MTKILMGLALLILAVDCMLSASEAVDFVDFLHAFVEHFGLMVGAAVCITVMVFGLVMIVSGLKSFAG